MVHDRYDQLSFLRTLEIISGLPSLNLGEALAVPLYNAVTPNGGNSAPYNAIMPSVNMTAVNPATAQNIAASQGPAAQRDRPGPAARARRDAVALPARLQVEAPAAGAERLHQDSKEIDDEAIDADELAREIRRLSTNPYEK